MIYQLPMGCETRRVEPRSERSREVAPEKRVASVRLVAATLIAFTFVAATALHASEASAAGPSVPEGWTFSLPDGDAAQGEAAFMKMRCFTCHVSRAKVPDAPTVAMGKGPTLGHGYAKLPKEYLAESIIRAHKVVVAPGYEMRGDAAGMGNYNYFMTVEELIDLVAYLRADAGD
jgi:mono/diheme cytochrome c family protein